MLYISQKRRKLKITKNKMRSKGIAGNILVPKTSLISSSSFYLVTVAKDIEKQRHDHEREWASNVNEEGINRKTVMVKHWHLQNIRRSRSRPLEKVYSRIWTEITEEGTMWIKVLKCANGASTYSHEIKATSKYWREGHKHFIKIFFNPKEIMVGIKHI